MHTGRQQHCSGRSLSLAVHTNLGSAGRSGTFVLKGFRCRVSKGIRRVFKGPPASREPAAIWARNAQNGRLQAYQIRYGWFRADNLSGWPRGVFPDWLVSIVASGHMVGATLSRPGPSAGTEIYLRKTRGGDRFSLRPKRP